MNKDNLIFSAKHSGGLKECLATECRMSPELFRSLTKYKIYNFYCIDERIGAFRFLICDIEHNLGFPQWIHVYISESYYKKRLKDYGN